VHIRELDCSKPPLTVFLLRSQGIPRTAAYIIESRIRLDETDSEFEKLGELVSKPEPVANSH
jgi:hypothetical protein